MGKNIIDGLRDYLASCIEKEGIICGKRSFSLQLGILENTLFRDMDENYSSIYNFSEYLESFTPEEDKLEELPVVNSAGDIIPVLNAVS